MEVANIIFLIVLVFCLWRGYRKGLLKSSVSVAALVLGYTAALVFSESVGAALAEKSQLQGLMAEAAAGVSLFISVSLGIQLLGWLTAKMLSGDDDELPQSSRIGGAVFSVFPGLLWATLSVWLYALAAPFVTQAEPSKLEKLVLSIGAKATASLVQTADVDPEIASLSEKVLENPAETVANVQSLSNSGAVEKVFESFENQELLAKGDIETFMEQPEFQQLAGRDDMRQLAELTGFVEDASSADYQKKLAQKMSHAIRRMRAMQNDARMQEILYDPEFQNMMRSGNALAILNDPRFSDLAGMLLTESELPPIEDVYGQDQQIDEQPASNNEVKTWVDENGVKHFSN